MGNKLYRFGFSSCVIVIFMLLFLLRYENKIKTVGVREKLMEDLDSADPL